MGQREEMSSGRRMGTAAGGGAQRAEASWDSGTAGQRDAETAEGRKGSEASECDETSRRAGRRAECAADRRKPLSYQALAFVPESNGST